MAKLVLTDASVTINSVNLSDHLRSVTLNYEAEVIENNVMGSTSRGKLAGLKNWTADIELAQDFAAASVDATLFPLVGAAAFPVVIKPTSGATSPTNPAYTGNAILASYPPLSGAVGELAKTTIKLEGDGLLTRAVA